MGISVDANAVIGQLQGRIGQLHRDLAVAEVTADTYRQVAETAQAELARRGGGSPAAGADSEASDALAAALPPAGPE